MPRGSFYFKGTKVFLTYARCDVPAETLLTHLQTLGKLSEYVIGTEAHQDGTPHLHCVLRYSPRIETRSSRYFDYLQFHPNIERPSTKADLQAVARYASKDGTFIQKGSLLKISRTDLYSKILAAPVLDHAFILSHPDILGLNFSSIQGWLGLFRADTGIPNPLPLPKKRHLWVYGPSNTGKTTWLRSYLASFRRARLIPPNNDWSHVDSRVDVLYKDEFIGSMTEQMLNSLCDGLIILNTKGGSTNIGQPLIIIVSNYSILECYPNSKLLDTLYNRFIEYLAPNFP